MTRTKAPRGEAQDMFARLVVLETDDCILWPFGTNPGGYGRVWDLTARCYRSTHVLALERREPCPEGKQAAHGPCHNRLCMNYRHLRWATRIENAADRLRDGTAPHGNSCRSAKLTERDVQEIRHLLESGMSQSQIGRRFGVTQPLISMIASGKAWNWLPHEDHAEMILPKDAALAS